MAFGSLLFTISATAAAAFRIGWFMVDAPIKFRTVFARILLLAEGENDMEYLVGTIAAFAFNYAPSQFVLCDGKSLPVAQYQQLYNYIGNRFGGDTTDFNVPDLSGAKLMPSLSYYIATSGVNPTF